LYQHEPKAPADIFRLIANNLTEMVMAYDMNRRLVFVNPAVETLTGYSIQELERDNFICWVHPEDQARMLARWGTLFQGKSYHEEEYRLVTKDGRVKWAVASWAPILDDNGRQVGVLGREFDITPRKLAETTLRHSEEKLRADTQRYRTIFEDSPFPMWEEDFSEVKRYLGSLAAAGVPDIRRHLAANRSAVEECLQRVRILDVNRAARDFYGASSKEELVGGLARIFDEAAFETFRDEIAALYENATSYQVEFPVRTLGGEERLVDMIVSIVDSARHDWSRVIVSFFDVTDRKRLEEQFVQSQKMESLGRMAGGIAHDFNNLLTVINGYTDWMLQDIKPDNPFRERMEKVRSAGERCAELTRQLLAFSRKHIAKRSRLDLNRIIEESLDVMGRVLGDDIRICPRLAAAPAIIEAERSQMVQVVMNLALNAREAMPGGGTLTIETRSGGDPPEVVLEVRDTGHGMDETTRRRLFEPFFTTKKGANNTGLGLAIVFGVVNHSGGRIEVESRPGEGAVFRVYLPAIDAGQETESAHSPEEPAHRGAGAVLVVDDREDVRTLTCHMLRELGYEPVPAASGPEAIAIARNRQSPIPLLLTDVVMPEMNGHEVAGELLRLYPAMKAILMSGYADRTPPGSGALQSATAYLQKPFTMAQLVEILRQVEKE
jgi:two-component system, cell cycle sensor histidine kinase and response regulator CckA